MNIIDLLREKGIEPRKVSTTRGGEFVSPCPGCGGEDRFHTWPRQNNGRGSWWCRGCGKGGDAIQFLREFSGMSFKDACLKLGLEDKLSAGQGRQSYWKATPKLPRQPEKKTLEPREEGTVADPWQQQAEKLLQTAEAALHDDQAALEHLEKTRGISPATAHRFRLGLLRFPGGRNCRFSSRKKWGLPLKETGKKPDALWLPRGLLIPGFAADGSLLRLRVRRPDGDHQAGGPKYYIIPGSAAAPLVINSSQMALVIVESELDGFLLSQLAGDLVGVVAMGSSAPRPTAGIHEILKEANLILLAFDADEAGQEAVKRWRSWYEHAYPCPIPGGHKDPGEALQAGEDLRWWIEKELPAAWRTFGKEENQKEKQTEPRADKSPLPSPPARASLIAGVPVLAALKCHDGGDPFYLVETSKEKTALAKIGRVAFLPREVEMSARLPPEMLRSFLDFNRFFPGSGLVKLWRTKNPGQKPHV